MTTNPLPNYIEPTVNAIMEDLSMRIKTKVDEIDSSMDKVYKVMVKIGAIPKKNVFE